MSQPQIMEDIDQRVLDTGDTMTGTLWVHNKLRLHTNNVGAVIQVCDEKEVADKNATSLQIVRTNPLESRFLLVDWDNEKQKVAYPLLHTNNISTYAWTANTNKIWTEYSNILCSGVGEWSIDITDTGTTLGNAYFHIWSGNNGVPMTRWYPATNKTDFPSGDVYISKTLYLTSTINAIGSSQSTPPSNRSNYRGTYRIR